MNRKCGTIIATCVLASILFAEEKEEESESPITTTYFGKITSNRAISSDYLHKKKFEKWEVVSYESGHLLDGGSLAFTFTGTNGQKSGLLVANPRYWMTESVNNQSLKKQKQVFYLTVTELPENTWYFKIGENSKEEKIVVQLLESTLKNAKPKAGGDKTNLKLALDHLQSRKVLPIFFDDGKDLELPAVDKDGFIK